MISNLALLLVTSVWHFYWSLLFGTSIGRFPGDGAANTAVKGLISK